MYGASLANSLKPTEAIQAYQEGLRLRPNYVRLYVNIGVAYLRKKNYFKAIEYFLNALILNPNAANLWKYLEQAIKATNRPDLKEKMKHKDPYKYSNDFTLVDPENLPRPASSFSYDAEREKE